MSKIYKFYVFWKPQMIRLIYEDIENEFFNFTLVP